MVHLTTEAASQIKRMLSETGQAGFGLRLGVRDGGCSGQEYLLEFQAGPGDDDLVYEEHGVKVFVAQTHLPFVTGSTIGWRDSLMETGIAIDNPNVKRACGCGTSVEF